MVALCSVLSESLDREALDETFVLRGGRVVVLVVAGLVSGPAGASSDDETPSIKKVMSKLHKGKNAPLKQAQGSPERRFARLGGGSERGQALRDLRRALPKNDPPRGEKESYEKLAKAYASAAKSLEESAEKEDLKGSRDAFKKISTSCMPCHKSHKSK